MTIEELKATLDRSGVPFAYNHWETKKEPPYGVYLSVYDNRFFADGVLYYWTGHYQIELYTKQKDQESEAKVENTLRGAGIVYEKSETYLPDTERYQIIYEIEV